MAQVELPFVVEELVTEHEQDFVQFFNSAISISPKLHMLHLLPGIGKKLMWEMLEARDKKPFESFADIASRVKGIPHPERMVIDRILEESPGSRRQIPPLHVEVGSPKGFPPHLSFCSPNGSAGPRPV